MIRINHILQGIIGHEILLTDFPLSEAVIDSRKAIPGSIFFALKGERADGHDYISDAFMNGALVAVIQKKPQGLDIPLVDLRSVEKFEGKEIPTPPFCILVKNSISALQDIARYFRTTLDTKVIGITGSVGKSSTKEMIADILSTKYATFKNPGNFNNEIGLPLTILNIGSGYRRIVLEMGFYYPGEIAFLCDIAKPSVGVVTNIGTVHAERSGSQEAIARGKSELIQSLPSDPQGVAVLNYDDPLVKRMADETRAKVIYYGLDPKADIWADNIRGLGLKGIRFTLHRNENSVDLKVPILGRHSVQTILRAAAVCLADGFSMKELVDGLMDSNLQLRLVAVKSESGALILDDTYNATPESTIAALDLLSELRGQKIAVLGDMLELGQYEENGHQTVGKRAAQVVNFLITVGPRGRIIAESAQENGLPPTSIASVKSSTDAAEMLRYNLKDGDVVLVKGSHGLRMDRISSLLEATK